MKDPAYLEEAKKVSIDVDPLTGVELAALVEQVSKRRPTPSRGCAPRWRISSAARIINERGRRAGY